jgi:hypothetical protein
MSQHDDDNDPMGASLPPEILKKCQEFGKANVVKGFTREQVKQAGNVYLKKLLEEYGKAPEIAPEGMSDAQRASLDLERACTGLPRLMSANDHAQSFGVLTDKQIKAIDLERACNGQDPLTADEIARLTHARSVNRGAEAPEVAPKGMNKVQLAQEQLYRATRGMPPLLAHDEDE